MKDKIRSLLLVCVLALPMVGFSADGDTLGTKVEDSVITTKIKAAYAKDKVVSATDISVETDKDGLVTLSGNAKSKDEADKAVKIAKKVKGVKEVKNDIVVQ
jgi:hyperosmotically inducible periplasmic protein